jgi:hypothetical protein
MLLYKIGILLCTLIIGLSAVFATCTCDMHHCDTQLIYGGDGHQRKTPRHTPSRHTPHKSPTRHTPHKTPHKTSPLRYTPTRQPYKQKHEIKPKYNNINPENIELLYNPGELLSHVSDNTPGTEFTRIIAPDAPRLAYKQADQFPIKTCIHWGQLKLMLTEVEFIALAIQARGNDPREIYLVYPGSAPGHHMNKLSNMFPDVHFELYDPNDFIPKDTAMIKTHVQFFMNADAEKWKSADHPDKFIIFNTDIRTFPATPEVVAENMQMQRRWYDIMRPELSMFKFRLPWNKGHTEYPLGDIYIQPFPGQSSTETRLIVKKDAKPFAYDHTMYEEQCAYHNNVMRARAYTGLYRPLNLHTDTLDNCYDCTAFLEICKLYLTVTGKPAEEADIIALAQDISAHIVDGKTLVSQTDKEYNDKIAKLRSAVFVQCQKKCKFCTIPDTTDRVFNSKRMHSHAEIPDE